MDRDDLIRTALDCGAAHAAYIKADRVALSDHFRAICKGNQCGNYGRSYMCPPAVGDIHELMDRVRGYTHAVLYQSIHTLEDSYDVEGMGEAGRRHSRICRGVELALRGSGMRDYLHLGTGCHLCGTCAYVDHLPCRFPDQAIPSLSGFGVDVNRTSQRAGLKYVNGQNTITYFGLVLWNGD